MKAPHYDIAVLLDASGLDLTLGGDLFGGAWEDQTDAQTLVLDAGGTPSELKELYEQVDIQILQRGEKNQAPHEVYDKLKLVSDYLLSQSDSVIANGCEYKGFEPASNIAPLGRDENERFVYSANFYTYRKGA